MGIILQVAVILIISNAVSAMEHGELIINSELVEYFGGHITNKTIVKIECKKVVKSASRKRLILIGINDEAVEAYLKCNRLTLEERYGYS